MTVTASNYEPMPRNFYETEPWVTEALLRCFPVNGMIVWEPAAGYHMMAVVLRKTASVVTSDIFTYEREHDFEYDFLEATYSDGPKAEMLVTNPPYGQGNRQAVKFCERALERCDGMVAMLLTAKFDFGKTRCHLFRDNPRFMAKINLLDRISWTGDGQTGTEDNAWYIWDSLRDKSGGPYAKPVIFYEEKQK